MHACARLMKRSNCQLSMHVPVCTCLDNLHIKLIKNKRNLCESLKLIKNNSSNKCPLTKLSLSAVQIELNSVNICFYFAAWRTGWGMTSLWWSCASFRRWLVPMWFSISMSILICVLQWSNHFMSSFHDKTSCLLLKTKINKIYKPPGGRLAAMAPADLIRGFRIFILAALAH
jgi:hypothetical protein